MKRNEKRFWMVFASIGAVIFAFVIFQLHLRYTNFTQNLMVLSRLSLGLSTDKEALYLKGEPTFVRHTPPSETSKDTNSDDVKYHKPAVNLPQGKSVHDYSYWVWDNDVINLSATFDKDSRIITSATCYMKKLNIDFTLCTTIYNISAQNNYSNEAYILNKIGKPEQTDFITSGAVKYKELTYQDYGLKFTLVDGFVE